MAHVLVVDDDADILELIRVNLETAGYRVSTATNGEEALAAVAKETPDAMFLDLMMPGVDGWEVLGQLKAEGGAEIAEIPVIMVTGRTEAETRLRSGIEGALEFVTKPFEPADLIDTLERVLDPDAPPEAQRRRTVQSASLEAVARLEATGEIDVVETTPRVHLTKLEHTPTSPTPSPRLRAARDRVSELTPKQRQLLEALAGGVAITTVAQELEMSRSNIYASLRRIGRRLGLKGTNELLALLRQGALLDA